MIVLAGAAVTASPPMRAKSRTGVYDGCPVRFLAESRLAGYIAGLFPLEHVTCGHHSSSGGWPLIAAHHRALALIFERLWSLRSSAVAPPGMVDACSPNTGNGGDTGLLRRSPRRPSAHRRRGLASKAPRGDEEAIEEGPRRHARSHRFPDRSAPSPRCRRCLGCSEPSWNDRDLRVGASASNLIQLAQGIDPLTTGDGLSSRFRR
jgi:hypothetical protein